MNWKKMGCLFEPTLLHPKLVSHAANPLPVHLDGDVYRIYFGGRDEKNRTSVGCVDIDIARRSVVYVHPEPVFEHGPAGSFYEAGVSIGNCYCVGDTQYMLFMGWQNPPGGHWRGDIGRLIVHNDYSLRLDSDMPFIGSDEIDPMSLSYPWVTPKENGYRMWYGSTTTWDAGNGEMIHLIKEANSEDGHLWNRDGKHIPYSIGEAQAFSRPTVAGNESDGYDMWFSYRSGAGEKYRIGYARQDPGCAWELRLSDAGIDVSPGEWDSEMIEYPFVFDHQGERYMLYNGNGYGKTGFGIAILDR